MFKDSIDAQTVEVNVDVKDWIDAIKFGGELLEKDGSIENRYIDAMIDTVKKMGPYIVIAPGIAMPHARPEAGAKRIRIGLLKLKNPVVFGNPEYDPVDIVIFLCAVDNSSHISVLAEFMQLLEDDDFLRVVRNASVKDEILDYINLKKFN